MKVLILSQNEISHNPRLLKAADYFLMLGWPVTVVNGVTGFGEKSAYERIKESRDWEVIENIIDKRNGYYYLRWGIISFLHQLALRLWSKWGLKIGFMYALNKGLLGAKIPKKSFDIILINLVDTLPLASKIKSRFGSKYLIYDSQEFFEGQYKKYEKWKQEWVRMAERDHVPNVDLILGTTHVMVERLEEKFHPKPVLRVRNVPYEPIAIDEGKRSDNAMLKMVWHGMSINYNNCRGIQVIVKALAKCNSDVRLTLQGKKIEKDYQQIKEEAKELGVWHKITFKAPVPPDRITESLTGFDVGVTGEIPEEENQILTSSNKLFEYIHAGLCTVAPDLPGISETIKKYNTGLVYQAENHTELATILDQLNYEKSKLEYYKNNSKQKRNELVWLTDYAPVCQYVLEDIKS